MPESFGARLRQRREEQQISLATIADQTKIKMSLLEALERDDFSHWPSGIFRRAYMRTYAKSIGLDPDVVVREFTELHPDPPEFLADVPLSVPPDATPQAPAGPPALLRNLVDVALGSLSSWSRRRRSSPAAGRPARHYEAPDFPEPLDLPEPIDIADDLEEPPGAQLPTVHEDVGPFVEEVVPPAASAGPAVPAPPPRPVSEPDFAAVARLCTEFGRIQTAADLKPLLSGVARVLEAAGLIVWIWDAHAAGLRAAVAHGYPSSMLAHLPVVPREADNATAAAFRLEETCAIQGGEDGAGALAVPLVTPAGTAGVLAVELQGGREQLSSVRAAATIFAAMLAQLMPRPEAAAVEPDVAMSAGRAR